MQDISTQLDTPVVSDRIIGSYSGDRKGKLVLIFAGIHGNEVCGVRALQRLFAELNELKPTFRGKLVGIAGNLPAIKKGKRYMDRDLNRLWSPDFISRMRKTPAELLETAEEREAQSMLNLIDTELSNGHYDQQIFIDLHGTSASGGGFCLIKATEANKLLAAKLFLPLVYGLEEKLHGTIQDYLYSKGMTGLTFEGGKIGEIGTLETHMAGLWVLMVSLGCLHAKDLKDFRHHINTILNYSENLPKSVKVIYRHDIIEEDNFEMAPGMRNFQKVHRGMCLGRDRRGEVYAPYDGLMLMPLYQPQGEDGFFLVQQVDY